MKDIIQEELFKLTNEELQEVKTEIERLIFLNKSMGFYEV